MPLLGYRPSEQMQVITVNEENFDKISAVDISNKYDDLIDGSTISTVGTPHHLKMKDYVSHIVMPSRHILVSVCQNLKTEEDRSGEGMY